MKSSNMKLWYRQLVEDSFYQLSCGSDQTHSQPLLATRFTVTAFISSILDKELLKGACPMGIVISTHPAAGQISFPTSPLRILSAIGGTNGDLEPHLHRGVSLCVQLCFSVPRISALRDVVYQTTASVNPRRSSMIPVRDSAYIPFEHVSSLCPPRMSSLIHWAKYW